MKRQNSISGNEAHVERNPIGVDIRKRATQPLTTSAAFRRARMVAAKKAKHPRHRLDVVTAPNALGVAVWFLIIVLTAIFVLWMGRVTIERAKELGKDYLTRIEHAAE